MNKDDIRRICNTSRQRELCCSGFDCECDKPGEAGSAGAEAESRRIEDALLALVPAEALPREPTPAMLKQGGQWWYSCLHNAKTREENAEIIWLAMYDAASPPMNSPQGEK